MVSPVPPGGGQNDGDVNISVRIVADQATINKSKAALADFKKATSDAFAPDNAKLQQARRAYQEHVQSIKEAKAQTGGAVDITDKWVRKVRELERQSALDKLSRELSKATKDGEKFETKLRDINAQLKAMGASEDEIGSVLGAAGNRAVIGGNRGAALQAFGREARLSLPAFPIPGTNLSTEFFGRIAEVGGRLGLTFKDLAITGGAVGFALVGVSLAVKNFQDRLKPVNDLLAGIVSGRAAAAGTATQGPQAIVDETERLRGDLERQRAERASLEADISTLKRNLGVSEDPNALLPGQTGIEAIFNAFAESQSAVPGLQANLDTLNASIAQNEAAVDDLNKRYQEAQVLAKITDLQEQYTQQLQQSGPVFEQLRQQYQDTIDSFNRANAERAEDKRIADAFEREDEQLQDEARANQHADALAKIENDGLARIEKARADSLERIEGLEEKRDERIAEIADNAGDAIAKVRADAREDEQKAEEDYQKARKRRLEDNAQDLLDAEFANDTAAFLQAQAQADKENDREKQDFEDEQAEKREAAEQRISEIKAEAEERTRIAIDQFNKEKAALNEKTQEQIVAELAAIESRKKAAIDAYVAETDALIASRERADIREAILQGIADNRRNAAHQQALIQIQQRQAAENALFTDILVKINTLRNQLATVNGQTYTPLLKPPPSNPGGFSRTAFAEGGLITKPTLALMGERPGYSEALIPFRRSEGLTAELAKLGLGGGGGGITINFSMSNVNLGAMTETTFKREMTHILQEQAHGMARARGMA